MKTRRLDDCGRWCLETAVGCRSGGVLGESAGIEFIPATSIPRAGRERELMKGAAWNVSYGGILLAEARARGRRDVLVHAARLRSFDAGSMAGIRWSPVPAARSRVRCPTGVLIVSPPSAPSRLLALATLSVLLVGRLRVLRYRARTC